MQRNCDAQTYRSADKEEHRRMRSVREHVSARPPRRADDSGHDLRRRREPPGRQRRRVAQPARSPGSTRRTMPRSWRSRSVASRRRGRVARRAAQPCVRATVPRLAPSRRRQPPRSRHASSCGIGSPRAPRTFKLDKFVTEPRHVGRSSPLVDVELRASLRPHAQHRRACASSAATSPLGPVATCCASLSASISRS